MEDTAVVQGLLIADVWQQGHEACTFYSERHGALKGSAIAGTLAAKKFALVRAHFLEAVYVFVIDERRPGTTFLGAKATAILATSTQLLANHELDSPNNYAVFRKEFNLGTIHVRVNRQKSEFNPVHTTKW